MFHLVKYRYIFLIISLLIIIPGTLSLIFKGLYLSADFRGGSIIALQPQKELDGKQVEQWLKPFNLQAVVISTVDNTTTKNNKDVPQKTIWVQLDHAVDSNVSDSIKKTLTDKYGKLTVSSSDIPVNGKTATVVTATGFSAIPKVSDIQSTLSKLPPTSDVTKGPATVSTTPVPSSTPTATATATTSSNPANIPVAVASVQQGQSTETINIQTTTDVFPAPQGKNVTILQLQGAIQEHSGSYTLLSSNQLVGPSVAGDTTRNAIIAVIVASFLILLYVWFSFRKLPRPWRYGACAIIALLHDVLVLMGIFSILGWVNGTQVDTLFITAVLTVVGFSVHDTIVVFDRIRENLRRSTSETFEDVVNASLVQTMSRSLNTSLTVLFTLLALTLFTTPGTSVHNFTLALLIGIFSGTYSSIFNASMMLVIWDKGELGIGKLRGDRNDGPVLRGGREARELARSRG